MKLVSLLLLTQCISLTAGDPVLKLTFLLFRHGDRSPANPYPSYPHSAAWPQGWGQLTALGMQEQYAVGKFLKQRYTPGDYLPAAYNRTFSYIRSSDIDRTIMSALVQLSGMFPPTGDQVWNKSMLWQPIPVHTVPLESDNVLRAYGVECPAYKEARAEFQGSQEFKEMANKYSALFNTISLATKSNVNLGNIWQYFDCSNCDKTHNLTLPEWANTNFATLRMLNNWDLNISYAREKVRHFLAGRLLYYFWEIVNAKMNGSIEENIYFLSAHDVTLISFLSAFNIWNWLQPPYASVVMAELVMYENKWYMQFYYKNTTKQYAAILSVPECGTLCPIDVLKEMTRGITLSEEEWENACGITTDSQLSSAPYIIAIYMLLLVIVFLFVFWIIIFQNKRDNKGKYELFNSDIN